MASRNDPRIDELADARGRFFGRAPVQGWPKPIDFNFHRHTFRDILEGKLTAHAMGPMDMNFTIHAPWAAPAPPAGHVKARRSVFEGFLSLGAAPDAVISDFASRFGPLLIYCRIEPASAERQLVVHESSEVWRYFARSMKSLLRIAAALHVGRRSDSSDWDSIGNCPFPVANFVEQRSERELRPDSELLGLEPFVTGQLWRAAASFIRRGSERNRAMWARLLNALLDFGRTRPWVIWDGSGDAAPPRMVFSGPYLLSYLALQLCLTALKQDAFFVCSFCRREYSPIRAPKAGQRNFCPDCRKAGVPVRVAQRTHRERLRQS